MIPSFYVASGSRPVVMLSILSLAGCFMRSNGGCQTPCLVISACAVAETASASTPQPSDAMRFKRFKVFNGFLLQLLAVMPNLCMFSVVFERRTKTTEKKRVRL